MQAEAGGGLLSETGDVRTQLLLRERSRREGRDWEKERGQMEPPGLPRDEAEEEGRSQVCGSDDNQME